MRSTGRSLVGIRLPAIALTAWLAGLASVEAGTSINTGYFGNVAIKGYDPVAYFTEGRAIKGSEDIAHEWLGAIWHFASAEHRELFLEQPMRYAPQYGGHCSGGVAFGENTVNIDPEAWEIVGGKLYLQYSVAALDEWREDRAAQIARADQNWPRIRARLEGEEGG